MKSSIRNALASLITVVITALSFPAFAIILDDLNSEDVNRFVTLYCNVDGMLVRSEFTKRVDNMLEKMDKAKTGVVNDKQFMFFLTQMQMSDGYTGQMISASDMRKKIEVAFDKVDTEKRAMLNKKQTVELLRNLMASGG